MSEQPGEILSIDEVAAYLKAGSSTARSPRGEWEACGLQALWQLALAAWRAGSVDRQQHRQCPSDDDEGAQ